MPSVPIEIQRPGINGNAYPGVYNADPAFYLKPAFKGSGNVDGEWHGEVMDRIPADYASGPAIRFRIVVNQASTDARWEIATGRVAEGATTDVALTAETAITVATPATANGWDDISIALANVAPAVGELLAVRIKHLGSHADDDITVADIFLFGAWFDYTAA